jgi:crotonobetainyl-CoA:carnitine CoA-transferase CaiB-like acyl-CoA transferase
MVIGQGSFDQPQLLQAAACDYTTGYLAALGTMAALWRRSHEGGSYHVRVSLCQTAGWFTGAAPLEPEAAAAPGFGDLESYRMTSDTPYGRLRHLGPVAAMSVTPPRWDWPSAPIGTHPAAWL